MEAKEIDADDAGWLRCAGGESALGADYVLELGMMSRSEQASAKGMPAYCIFSNAVLEAIAAAAVSAHALRRCV